MEPDQHKSEVGSLDASEDETLSKRNNSMEESSMNSPCFSPGKRCSSDQETNFLDAPKTFDLDQLKSPVQNISNRTEVECDNSSPVSCVSGKEIDLSAEDGDDDSKLETSFDDDQAQDDQSNIPDEPVELYRLVWLLFVTKVVGITCLTTVVTDPRGARSKLANLTPPKHTIIEHKYYSIIAR